MRFGDILGAVKRGLPMTAFAICYVTLFAIIILS
jgi:hypothetical protein